MDGDEESKTDTPTQEELRQRRLAYFGTRTVSTENIPVDNTNITHSTSLQTVTKEFTPNLKHSAAPQTVTKEFTPNLKHLAAPQTVTKEFTPNLKHSAAEPQTVTTNLKQNTPPQLVTKEIPRSHTKHEKFESQDPYTSANGMYSSHIPDKNEGVDDISSSMSHERDAGSWDVKSFASRDFQNDDFDELKEQLKQQSLDASKDGYNELVERLIQCAKRDIIEREESQRSVQVSGHNGSMDEHKDIRQTHTGLPMETDQEIRDYKYTLLKHRNAEDLTIMDRHPVDQLRLSTKDSQDFDQMNVFQNSVDFDHSENIGLHTHRNDSVGGEHDVTATEQEKESLEEKIRKKSPRVLDGIVSNELKGVLGEMKYKAFLEKSMKEIDELQQGQNSDRSRDKQQKQPRMQNREEKPLHKPRKSVSNDVVNAQISEQNFDKNHQHMAEDNFQDFDGSTLVNGSLTEITNTDFDGGQEPPRDRPLLNRPKYDPIRNVHEQQYDGKDGKNSVMSAPRNYEQVTVPRNVVFSASQIYHQAYKQGQIPGYDGMPPSMFPYHQEMAMNPAMMHMSGYPYGNMYDSMQHNPYYPRMPFRGPPTSPIHGQFMFPPYPVQGSIPNLSGGPAMMPQPSDQGPAVEAYLQQLSARSYQSYDGSDVRNQYTTNYLPFSKVPHPPESKPVSSKKPPLPNNTVLKSSSVQSLKMGQPAQMFYPPELYSNPNPNTHHAVNPHPASIQESQSGDVPPEFHQNYTQQMAKGIPYPPPPDNVDLQMYFQFLESQGYPVPYQMMMAPPKSKGMVEQSMDGGTPQVPYEMMVPRPPPQSKKTNASPRHSTRHEKLSEGKKSDSVRQFARHDSLEDKASQSSQRHVDGIRQYHEQNRRQQQEDEEVLDKQRTYAKASIDRYFNSLENYYHREKESREEEKEEPGVNTRDERLNDGETMVNSEVTVATMKAGGITDRMEKLGIDLSFLRDGKEPENLAVTEDGKKGDNSKDKRVIVCPECGEINKPYMTWCADCGDVLIGVEPILPTKKRYRNKVGEVRQDSKTDKNVTFDDKTDSNHGEVIDTIKEYSPVSPKGKFSPNKSESRDSGRPSSEDLDFGRTEKEVIDICESIDDPVVRGFITSYFNRKRHALEETRKSLESEFQEVANPPRPEPECGDSPPPSRDTEISIDLFDNEELRKKEDIWLQEQEQVTVEVEDKPLKGRKSGPLDIEVFSVADSRQSRNSSRMECVVPMLNLVNSSDEEDEEVTKGPLRPAPVSMSMESDDWHYMFEQEVRPPPPAVPVPALADLEDEEKNLLEQIIEQESTKKPPPSSESNTRKGSLGKNKKSKLRSSIEAPGYARHWEKSSVAWGSYHPRELSTNSSVNGPQTSQGRPVSGSRRQLNHSVSVDNDNSARSDSNLEGGKRNKKPRPSSADLSKRKQRPASAQNRNRKTADVNNGNGHVHAHSANVRHSRSEPQRSSETGSTPQNTENPRSPERKTSPARRHRHSQSQSPEIVENSQFIPRPPKASEGGREEHVQRIPSPQGPPSRPQSSATPTPDSPASLPYVIDHRLPAEVVMDPPLTSHTNTESVLHAYSKYREMTPRIQKGKFSAWLCLPDEILLNIFSCLSTSDLARCARACSSFHRVAMDASLWKYITVKKKHHLTDESLAQIGKRHPVSLALIQCHGDNITAKGLRDLFRECGDGLKELNLCGCSRGALTGDCILLHASARCRGLTHVDASWCNVTDSGIGAISGSSDRLESLCINGCQNIKDEGLETVIKKHGKSLRHLEMFGCFNVTPKSIRFLANHCLTLQNLNLGQCYKMTDSCISQLSSSLGRVENLDLRGCKQIKDNCIRYVVKNCPRLQTITLANCPNITDVAMLEVSTYITDIRNIDVCGCRNITDNSIRALANNCQNLRNIDISSTGCSHRSVSMLANFCNQRLETVKLNFLSDITDSVIVKLAKHCKRLKLLHLYGCTSIRSSDKIKEVNPSVSVEM